MSADNDIMLDPVEATEDLAQELMRQLDLLNGNKVQEDISYGQYRIISVVHTRGPISIGKLGSYVGLAQSTTSEMVARLKKTGLVTKVKGPYDGRVVMVELTEQGRDLMQRRKQRVRRAYRKLFTKLDEQDQRTFTDCLRRLSDILDRTMEI